MNGSDPGAGPGPLAGGLPRTLLVATLGLFLCVLIYVILRELAEILRPLFIALFVAYLILPFQRRLVRLGLRPLLAYVVIIIVTLVGSYFLGVLVANSTLELARELPTYVLELESQIQERLDTVERGLRRAADAVPRLVDEPTSAPATQAATAPAHVPVAMELAPPGAPAAPPPRLEWLSVEQLVRYGRGLVQTLLGLTSGVLVVAVYLIFLLAEQAGLPRRLEFAFGPRRAAEIGAVIAKINYAISRYIVVKTFVSALTGMCTWVVLFLFGVPYALVWALLTFLGNYIPYLGSLVAVLLPIAMAFVQFPTATTPITIGVLLIVIHQVIGNYVEPRLSGRELGISPLLVLLAVAFWGLVWGIPGMVLATPLAVVLKIILENIGSTQPLARLVSDTPGHPSR